MTSRLYPTLVADSSLEVHVSDQQDTLQMQLSTEVDKYLQESAEKQEMNVNYFDGQHVATNHQQIDDVAEIGKDNIPELVIMTLAKGVTIIRNSISNIMKD